MKTALQIASNIALSAIGILGLTYLVVKDRFERTGKREMHH